MGVFCAYVVTVPLEIIRTNCTVHYIHFVLLILCLHVQEIALCITTFQKNSGVIFLFKKEPPFWLEIKLGVCLLIWNKLKRSLLPLQRISVLWISKSNPLFLSNYLVQLFKYLPMLLCPSWGLYWCIGEFRTTQLISGD